MIQGAAHSSWASKDKNLREVVEVISTAQENLDVGDLEKKAGIVDEEVSSDSDDSSDDEGMPDGSAGNRQGPIDQIKDYKRKEKALHRKHRGIMQWKVIFLPLAPHILSAILPAGYGWLGCRSIGG